MTSFQLDENVDIKRFAERCCREGQADVRRFRPNWKKTPGGFKDSELLPTVMASDTPLVTNDRNIAAHNIEHIPAKNPGILIIGLSIGSIRPLGKRTIENLVGNFKRGFPKWHSVSWSNSIVEITDTSVQVWHIENDELISDGYHLYKDDPNWPTSLENSLEINARRYLLAQGES